MNKRVAEAAKTLGIYKKKKWALTSKKAPVNPRIAIDYVTGVINLDRDLNEYKVMARDERELTSLEEIEKYFEVEYASYFITPDDGFVVLDIEPTCDKLKKENFLKYPALYVEESSSGKGLHMFFSTENFKESLIELGSIKNGKEYEILQKHFVIITGKKLKGLDKLVDNSLDFKDVYKNEIFEKEMKQPRTDVRIYSKDIDLIYKGDEVIEKVKANLEKYPPNVSLENSNYDYSSYEYSMAAHVVVKTYNVMRKINNIYGGDEAKYSPSDLCEISEKILSDVLKKRDKHFTYRNSLPWLYYLCEQFIMKSDLNFDNFKEK